MMAVRLLSTIIIICVLSSYAQTPQHEYDVIIMGAGASGIAAAKTLYEANITNILIIEAQWYIGGRTVVHHFADGYMLNIGAAWIDGACIDSSSNCSHYKETNPMLTAAYKYNISFIISDWEDIIILDFGGNEHNKTNSNNRFDKFYQAQDCISNIMQNVTKPEQISYFAALYLCGWKKPLQTIDKTVQWYTYDFNAQHAKWSRTPNAKYERTFSTFGPDGLFITDPRGYQGIIKALLNEFIDINDTQKIKLNSPITKIEYDKDGVMVTLDANNNNTQYYAKYGIVTFPLGVLQSDIVQFYPTLPLWKIDALLAFDFIDATPIYVKWPYNFWSDKIVNNSEFILLNDDRFGFFTWIYNLDHPKLFNGSLIWRFDATLDLAQIVAMENLNDTIKQIVELKLSHYFDNVPNPTDIFVASWHSNPYIQGSYSNWPVGFSDNSKEAMVWPLLQRLFFAGEAMSDFDYGYVHSAWLSGNDTANQILACMGYDVSVTNGFECPKEYVPPSDGIDCKTLDESVFKDLVWLWIVFSVLFGIILYYLFVKYCYKIVKNDKENNNTYYGAVEDTDVPMVTQNTAKQK